MSALIRFDNGHTGVLMAARNAGAWSEKLDAYGLRDREHLCTGPHFGQPPRRHHRLAEPREFGRRMH